MPRTEIVFYSDDDGSAPVLDAVRRFLREGQRKEFAMCQVRITRLAECGHDLRRPEAEYLRDGVYELRITHPRAESSDHQGSDGT